MSQVAHSIDISNLSELDGSYPTFAASFVPLPADVVWIVNALEQLTTMRGW